MKEKSGKKRYIVRWIVLVLLVFGIGACVWYVNDYYRPVDVEQYMAGNASVVVREVKNGWLFDGSGEDTALVFYPGAKVAAEAYAPVLSMLAEQGVDCFLVKMPCKLAFFGMNRVEDYMDAYSYQDWYLMGHSLGGATSAMYAAKHAKKLNGLIFLAAYSNKDLTDKNLPVLSIYGSRDGVLNMQKVQDGRALIAKDQYEEHVIYGGNHDGFGSYGHQEGDNEAEITKAAQWNQTVQTILAWLSR